MNRARRHLLTALLVTPIVATVACTMAGSSASAESDPVENSRLSLIASGAAPGLLGAAVLDLSSGELYGVNADVPMPLQSVFKLPLAIHVMHLAEQGEISLEERVVFARTDLSIFYSPITDAFDSRQAYTVRELVAAVVSDSDNTAADYLLERVGGPAALTQFFKERGLRSFRIDRYERELQPESVGLPLSAGRMADAATYREYRNSTPIETRIAGMRRYLADPRDRMSARDAVQMLKLLDDGRLLNAEHTRELMVVLLGTPSGPNRLRAGAPEGALVYHKTGSSADVGELNGATNDIGILALPDGRRLAVAAFLAGSTQPIAERERTLAEVARAAVDAAKVDGAERDQGVLVADAHAEHSR